MKNKLRIKRAESYHLALRGHRESKNSGHGNKGNFLSIVDLIQLESPTFEEKLSSLPKNANYLGKDSQNELLQSAASVIKDQICSEVKRAPCFSVIADEALDVSRTEQMSICVRYLNEGEVCERFLQFVDTHSFDAASLSNEIARCLTDNGFDLSKCVALCYDGASVMSGRHAGVQVMFYGKPY